MDNSEIEVSRWVDGRLALLEPAAEWQPDVAKAWTLLRARGRFRAAGGFQWIWAAAAAACVAIVLGVVLNRPAVRTPVNLAPAAKPELQVIEPLPAPIARSTPQRPVPTARTAPALPPAAKPDRNEDNSDIAQLTAPGFKEVGSAAAPIVVVIYFDFECGHCVIVFTETIPLLTSEYVNSGKVRLVRRDLPARTHRFARLAARYANAAGLLGDYDTAVAQILKTQSIWDITGDIASQLAQVLPPDDMRKIQYLVEKDPRPEASIAADEALANQDGIRATPSLVIIAGDKRQVITGVPQLELLKGYLDRLLPGH
jgi:protein-disulfide isomerase